MVIDSVNLENLSLAYISQRIREKDVSNDDITVYNNRLAKRYLKDNKSYDREYSKQIVKSLIVDRDQFSGVSIVARHKIDAYHTSVYFKIADGQLSGNVYKTVTDTSTNSLGSPTIAVKHNTKKLEGWDIMENGHKRNSKRFHMLLTDDQYNTYVSISKDGGMSWSHPERGIRNHYSLNFFSSMYKSNIAIISKRVVESEDYRENDIMIWKLKSSQVNKLKSKGILYRIANDPDPNSHWSISLQDSNDAIVVKSKQINGKILIEGYYIKIR